MKRLCIAVFLLGCGSSSDPAQQQPTPIEDTGVVADNGPPGPEPGDPPRCEGEPSPGTPPGPRAGHAGALDKSGKHFVVFGGDTAVIPCGESGASNYVDETFVLDVGCGTWKPVGSKGPSARTLHVMAPDPRRERALVFGGRGRDELPLNDLWGFDFSAETWTKLETSGTAPSKRAGMSAVYDQKGDRMIVFGGDVASGASTTTTPSDETFALNLEFREWSAIATSGVRPPPRIGPAAAIDEGTKLYVFGGADPNKMPSPFFDDLWVLDLASNAWSRVEGTGDAPSARASLAMSYDTPHKRLIVFAGGNTAFGNHNDVHVFDLATRTWTRLNTGDRPKSPSTGTCAFPADYTEIDKVAPERRSSFAFSPSLDRIGFLVHGGRSDCGLLSDAAWFNALNEDWFPITTSTAGHSCLRNSDACTSLCK